MWYLTLFICLIILPILIAMSKLHLRNCSSWLKRYNGATFDDCTISNFNVAHICIFRVSYTQEQIFKIQFPNRLLILTWILREWPWLSFYNTVPFTYRRSKTRERFSPMIKSPKFYHRLVHTYMSDFVRDLLQSEPLNCNKFLCIMHSV